MKNAYTAVIKKEGDCRIGWIEEVPGINCQEASHEELGITLYGFSFFRNGVSSFWSLLPLSLSS